MLKKHSIILEKKQSLQEINDEIVNSDKVILPGVGAFADAMEKIRHYALEETIHEVVEEEYSIFRNLSWVTA